MRPLRLAFCVLGGAALLPGISSASDEKLIVPLETGATLEWKRAKDKPGVLKVKKVNKASAVAQLGYTKGDEIISIDGQTIGERSLAEFLGLSREASAFQIRRKKQMLDLPPMFRAAGIIEGTDEHSLRPGQPLPSIEAKTWEGKKIDPEILAGKVVLITFWAAWCKPCMEELPELIQLYRRYASQGMIVLAINIDDDKKAGQKALTSDDPAFFILHDTGFGSKTSSHFRVSSIPLTLLVDRDGVIRQVCRGYSPTGLDRDLRRPLELLLKGITPLVNVVNPR